MFLGASDRKPVQIVSGERKGMYLLVQVQTKSLRMALSVRSSSNPPMLRFLSLSLSFLLIYQPHLIFSFRWISACSHGGWQETYDWPSAGQTHNHGTGHGILSWLWFKVLIPGDTMYWDLQLHQNPQVSRGHSHQIRGAMTVRKTNSCNPPVNIWPTQVRFACSLGYQKGFAHLLHIVLWLHQALSSVLSPWSSEFAVSQVKQLSWCPFCRCENRGSGSSHLRSLC